MSPRVGFKLMLVTDRHALAAGCSLQDAVADALRGGVDAVQLREKDLSAEALLALACELREVTRAHGAALIVNSGIDVALACDADGAHLPAAVPDVAAARLALGEERLVGVSTHSVAEVVAAGRARADYVMFGPVYATPSKARYGRPLGLDALRDACAAAAAMPVFALGGITPQRAGEVVATGARVAAISGLLRTGDPREAARRYARQAEAMR